MSSHLLSEGVGLDELLSSGLPCFSFPRHPSFPYHRPFTCPCRPTTMELSIFCFLVSHLQRPQFIFMTCRQTFQVIDTVYVFETANQRLFYMESRGKGVREQSQTLKRPQKKTTHSSQLTIFNNVLNQYRECFKSQAMVQILACPFTRSMTLNKLTLIFECQVSLSVGKVGELRPHQVVEE